MNEDKEIVEIAKYIFLTSRAILSYCKQEKRVKNRGGDGSFICLQICHIVKRNEPVSIYEIAESLMYPDRMFPL